MRRASQLENREGTQSFSRDPRALGSYPRLSWFCLLGHLLKEVSKDEDTVSAAA